MSLLASRAGNRALALLLLLAVLLLAWSAVVAPLVGLTTERLGEITMLSERLATLRGAISRIPALQQQAAALRARFEAEGGLWTGSSETFVATSMQAKLRDAVTAGQGRIRSTSQLRGTDEAGLRTVRVRVVIDGTLETLVRTLAAIQTARPPMFVDNLSVTAPANVAADKPPVLALDAEVIGYMHKPPE
jgi:general secretion pathway protein M